MSPAKEKTQQRGCLLKILIGCGVLVLLVVLLGFAGCLWLSTPGKQIETAAIQGEASLGTMEVEDLLEDEGFGALVEAVVNEMNAQNDRNLPRWMPRNRSSAKDMGIVIPKSATVTFEDVAGAERPPFVAAINFRGWVRPLKMVFRFLDADDEDVRDYRGHRIISADDRFMLAFHESTLLASDHPAALERVLDRLIDGTGTGIPPLPEGALPDGVWDATGGMRNDAGRLDQLLARLPEEGRSLPELGAGATLGFGVDVETADRAEIRVDLAVADGAQAASAVAHLEALADRLLPSLEKRGLPTTGSVRAEGNSAVATFEVLGLQDAVLDAFDEVNDFDPDFDRDPPDDDPPATAEPRAGTESGAPSP